MKPEDFDKELERIMRKLLKEATSTESLQELGDDAAELIKKRTRLGYGLSEHGGTKSKLKQLNPKYKKYRQKIDLSSATTPNKSNLTQTGHMLDDIGATVGSNNSVSIGFTDDFANQKAEWVSEDRPFNFLSKAEISQLRKKLQDKLYSRIKELIAK